MLMTISPYFASEVLTMKRYALTACLSIACCLCVFFFSSEVHATGTVNKTSSATFEGPNSNYHASIRATQYQGVATAGNGTSTSAYVGQSAIVVTANFYNEGDEPWYLDGVHVQLHDSTTTSHKLTDLDILGGNLTVSQINTPYIFTIGGGENNSYNQGFVVAPHSKLSVAFRVSAFATSDSGNSQFSLDHVSTGAVTNTVGDYPYGVDVDYSPLIDYLNSDVVPELLDQGMTLDDILNLISSYPDAVNYVPTNNFRYFGNSSYNASDLLSFNLFEVVRGGEIVDTSFDYSFADYNVSRIYKVNETVVLSVNNTSDDSVTLSTPFNVSVDHHIYSGTEWPYLFTSYNFESTSLVPTDNTYIDKTRRTLYLTSLSGSSIVIAPHSSITFILECSHFYGTTSDATFWVGHNPCTFSFGSVTCSSVNDDVISDMNNIHNQEQQYFSDTNSAIGDTGLESYQFDQGTSSGMHGIKDDFTSVWNACGSLSNVWIFSLTFSVALSIIRHVRLKHF